MKGFIKQAAAVSCFGAALFTVLGCTTYRNLVDPCWPERYNSSSRHSVRDIHNAQADLGHKLDQTIWNHHFDPGTDILNAAGKDQLRYIARRQPIPDFQVWLQFPHDVAKDRDGMIARRKDAIRSFMATQTLVSSGNSYQIEIHDLAVPTYPANLTENAVKNVDDLTKKGSFFPFPATSGGK